MICLVTSSYIKNYIYKVYFTPLLNKINLKQTVLLAFTALLL